MVAVCTQFNHKVDLLSNREHLTGDRLGRTVRIINAAG